MTHTAMPVPVHSHLVNTDRHPGALNGEAAEQLLDVVRTYLK